MKNFFNKIIPTEVDEFLTPEKASLLIIDMQNDFCSPGGVFEKAGSNVSCYKKIIPKIQNMLISARKLNVLVIFIQNTSLKMGKSDSRAQIRFSWRAGKALPYFKGDSLFTYTIEGTWGHEIIEELSPVEDDLVVQKYRSSAFVGTNLDLILRSNQIETLIITGCSTEGCVDSTIRDGLFYDYFTILVEDCVYSDNEEMHDAALTIMKNYRTDYMNSESVIKILSRGGLNTV